VRPVAMSGLALLAGGSLLLARVPGPDLVGLLVFGAGLGAAFVSAQIAAVASAPEDDTGLVAGIADTSFTIGGLLGVAVMATIPATRSALVLGAGVAVVGLVLAATLLGTPRRHRAAAP
jgi:predicted MFS family arabinose efflux permease